MTALSRFGTDSTAARNFSCGTRFQRLDTLVGKSTHPPILTKRVSIGLIWAGRRPFLLGESGISQVDFRCVGWRTVLLEQKWTIIEHRISLLGLKRSLNSVLLRPVG